MLEQFKPITVTGIRDKRFGEILVIKDNGVEIYNTTGLNDCPAELWDSLDLEKLKDDFSARAIQKNGPKFWMMDSQTVYFGETASFGGLEARLAAIMEPSALGKEKGSTPYQIFNPKKTQKMIYEKEKSVFELVDPEGHVYALQAHEERFPLASLSDLGDKMSLPEGWQYRSRQLQDDLILDLTLDKTIYGVGDEFHQYYTRITE